MLRSSQELRLELARRCQQFRLFELFHWLKHLRDDLVRPLELSRFEMLRYLRFQVVSLVQELPQRQRAHLELVLELGTLAPRLGRLV